MIFWIIILLKRLGSFLSYLKGPIIFILCVLLVRGSLLDWYIIPSGSMVPTLLKGDLILVNKVAYDLHLPFTTISLLALNQPKRGDLVVFYSKSANKRMIKRLIGLPNDQIMIRNNRLYINGRMADYQQEKTMELKPLRSRDQPFGTYLKEGFSDRNHVIIINPSIGTALQNIGPIYVAKGHYFVLGDNRDNSSDSRVYGLIPHSELKGKAIKVLVSVQLKQHYSLRVERFWQSLTQ